MTIRTVQRRPQWMPMLIGLFTAVLIGFFFLASPASAATVTWDGGGDGSTWSDGNNWDTNSVPGAGDTAVIDTATTVNLTAATTIGDLVVGDAAGSVAAVLNFSYDALNVGGVAAPLVITTASGGAGSVNVYNSAKITHAQNTTTNNYNIYMDVSGDFEVHGSAFIDVNGLGCEGAASAIGRGPRTSDGLCAAGATGSGGNPGDGAGYGGEGGRSESGTSDGDTYGSATQPNLVGSAGGGDSTATPGGNGGGLIYLEIDGNFGLDGTVRANAAAPTGGNGTTNTASGGSGGGVYISVAGSWNGSGTVTANGSNGQDGTTDAGGGGGGGRIAVVHGGGGTFSPSNTSLVVAPGDAGTPSSVGSPVAAAGDLGTVYVKDTGSSVVTVFHGFTYDDTDYSETTWTMDSSATNQYCETGASTPSITAGTLNLDGAVTCSSSALTTFNLTTTSDLSVANGFTFDLSGAKHDADSDWTIPDGDDQTWTNVTISMPGSANPNTDDEGGFLTIDDVITLNLSGTTAVNGNVEFLNLDGFSLGASASLNASEYGCTADNSGTGSGPNSSNICANNGQGSGGNGTGGGGAGHGGAGGSSSGGTSGGATYGSETAPVLIGAAGGADSLGRGGNGGGLVRIEVDAGNMTLNGSIAANGGDGTVSGSVGGGGGAGGSIYITVSGVISGSTGSLSADGGLGGDSSGSDGGSGGGGRIRVEYGSDTTSFLSGLTAAGVVTGGAATGGGSAGSNGSLSIADIYGPSFSSAEYQDSNNDGQVDRVVITFTETVSIGGTVSATTRFTLTSPSGATGFAGSLSGNASDNADTTVTLTLTGTDTDETGASGTVQIAYDDNTDDATNKLQDGSGNIVQSFSAQTVNDGADPLMISSSPEDGERSISRTADIVLTFSESISTGSFAYTCCGDGNDPGRSGAWTSSDTVYTITPDGSWTGSDDITINVTAAPDGSGNSFAGAGSLAADPFTFTIVSSGSGSSFISNDGSVEGGTVTSGGPQITITAPNGGEVLEGNRSSQITWNYTGTVNLVNLAYSTDGGSNWTAIANNVTNTGYYDWTVPDIDASTVLVRVQGTDLATTFGGDTSDASFAIDGENPVTVDDIQTSDDDEETDTPTSVEMTSASGMPVTLTSGSLFRGVELSGVYIIKNGKRYVFPSESVYFSYYADFSGVVMVQDNQLRKLTLGGRVTMNAGKLIKIESDPKVYEVQADGTIRHVPDEATAIARYGTNWNTKITDISIAFWNDYRLGEPLPAQ